jgi:hypothetical protein
MAPPSVLAANAIIVIGNTEARRWRRQRTSASFMLKAESFATTRESVVA